MPDLGPKQTYKARKRRHRRVRSKIYGTAERPRMNIYRSLSNIFVQVINDDNGETLVQASTIDREVAPQVVDKSKVEASKIVGRVVAERAKHAGIDTVVFDRGGYRYHGRVAAVAEGAREAGLKL